MKKLIEKARRWLTDARRQAVHAALSTVAALAVTVGVVDDAQSAAVLAVAGSTLALAQGALGLSLLRKSEAAVWFGTVGRGLVYGVAAAAGAAGIVFNLTSDADVTRFLAIVTATSTVVSAFFSVVNVQTVDAVDLTSRRAYRASLED